MVFRTLVCNIYNNKGSSARMISVKEAQKIVLNAKLRHTAEKLPILEAIGMIMAEDIISSDDIPIYDNSAMDGYAVRTIDVKGADKSYPIRLIIAGESIPAGKISEARVEPGYCIPIMTGAPMPAGADSVVIKEDTQRDSASVMVFREIKKGENVRYRGEDIKKGNEVFKAGDIVNPASIYALASLGIDKIKVYRAPVIGILATGDELIGINEKLMTGKVRDSNSYLLSAQVKDMNIRFKRYGVVCDDEKLLLKSIKKAVDECEILILSGRISVGEYDLVKEVLDDLGAELIFWRVNQSPGRPLAFFKYDSRFIFGLPGNPASAMICFEIYIRPLIRRFMGYKDLFRPEVDAEAIHDFKNKTGRVNFVRVIVERKQGDYFFKTAGSEEPGILSSMISANGIAYLPPNTGDVKKGSRIKVYLLSEIR